VPDSRGWGRAITDPIGTPLLRELARGRRNAVIAVDDITRPTPVKGLLSLVLRELEKGKLPPERIRVIVATGAHRPALRADIDRKVGRRLARLLDIHVHNPYEGLTRLGYTQTGLPIHLNQLFMEGDLKIAIGGITPHESVGFAGGSKTVAMGLAGMETLHAFHARDQGVRTGQMVGNLQQDAVVEIAQQAGLEFVVNAVFAMSRGVAALVAGHPVFAHEAGVALAREAYATLAPPEADIVVLNAYPRDTDLLQSYMALNVAWLSAPAIVRRGGSIIVTAACPEGSGVHFLAGHRMRHSFVWTPEQLEGYDLSIVSPNLSIYDVRHHFPDTVRLYQRWADAIKALVKQHGVYARAVVYPCAALHLPEVETLIGV
jgi:nickel-dependent lactate racemase